MIQERVARRRGKPAPLPAISIGLAQREPSSGWEAKHAPPCFHMHRELVAERQPDVRLARGSGPWP